MQKTLAEKIIKLAEELAQKAEKLRQKVRGDDDG